MADGAGRELDVFATGDTMLVEAADGVVVDTVRRGAAAVRHVHARPGFRPGGGAIATTSGRRVGLLDVVHPVPVDPRRASRIALDGLFDHPVDGFAVDDEPTAPHPLLVWNGRLTGAHDVRVALHLLASPSLVVTVLELVPQQRVRWQRETFVRAGIDVVEALAGRLLRLAS